MKLQNVLASYKCAALTAIAVLLGFILWRMPERPLTLEGVRAAKMRGWQAKDPLVYVGAGNIEVDNTVEVAGDVWTWVTPAMEAGISSHVWSVREIVELYSLSDSNSLAA